MKRCDLRTVVSSSSLDNHFMQQCRHSMEIIVSSLVVDLDQTISLSMSFILAIFCLFFCITADCRCAQSPSGWCVSASHCPVCICWSFHNASTVWSLAHIAAGPSQVFFETGGASSVPFALLNVNVSGVHPPS